MKQKNYYEILGVSEHSTAQEIKSAYRGLAKQFHPDKNPGDKNAEARFKEISEAYEVAGDPDKRRRYDELRHYSSSGGAGEGMSYEEFIRRFGGSFQSAGDRPDEFTWGFGVSNLDDLFSTLFGGSGSSKRTSKRAKAQSYEHRFAAEPEPASEPQPTPDPFFKRKGPDAYVDITINLAQALLGSKIRVRTPSGKSIHVKIPAGAQPAAVLRIRGMGFGERAGQGDLYIRMHLELPRNLTHEQEELLRRFAAKTGMRH